MKLTESERDFQRAVMELAELSGWETLHVRTSMQAGRYLTATTGTMAKGWPDLVLAHPKERRLLFVELKADAGRLRAEQKVVLTWLLASGANVEIWRPRDWGHIEATLTKKEDSRDAA